MRLGVTFSFGLAYFGNQEYFEPIFLSTVFGICNIFARSTTIAAPMVAEVVPEPILTITICTFTAAVGSAFLHPQTEGSFQSSGKKGKIAFVEGSALDEKEFNSVIEQKPVDGVEEVKKELFLLEDEEEGDQENNFDNRISNTSDKPEI